VKKIILLFVVVFVLPSLVLAQDFSALDKILKSNVVVTNLPGGGIQTAFDYKKAVNNPETMNLIKEQKKVLKAFNPSSLKTKNEAVSFWINSYNFFMSSTVIEKGFKGKKLIINSVKDREEGFGTFVNRYKVFQREIHNIGGKKYSLDQMEKGHLLSKAFKKKSWKDARIHFVVNCASVGCPPLANKIYEAKTLDKDLTMAAEKSFMTQRHFKFKGKTLHITQLFQWYKGDFVEAEGSVKKFLKKYTDKSMHAKIDKADIKFIDYDWNLNRPANFK